ncbi:ATP-binding protein [Tardiphaga robiniae]|uniref:ATP-binding protein n=1 Tax=Tardiphaga robiniae TaxID=943830 RepID=A0A7G6U2C0_9BRAD|nr:ATP-binding protein [Tardiphaga robiniae]QND73152.1 ATP-binding protein [Tardiphaga robiniae]
MAKGPKRPSAAGEISAVTGYLKQYEYSACVLYRLMQASALEGVTVSLPAAGMFDDLVLHANGSVWGTQLKSQIDASYVSLATELSEELIQSMAQSWLSLEQTFGEGSVRLHYIFAGYFSKSDTHLANIGTSGSRHSAEFARFISKGDHTKETLAQAIWSTKLAELETLSGLNATQFLRFMNSLTFADERDLLRNQIENFDYTERSRIEEIKFLLPKLIAKSAPGKRWSEQELVDELGWRSRITQHNSHVFPVPEDFQENEATEARIFDALGRTISGYIALVGPPGTGKSTLLQRTVHSTPEYSISRYLAFHPGQRHGLGRAEAGEFLNDVIAELRSQGLYGSRFGSDKLSGLRVEFMKQLEGASERFRATGRKTVLIIDGLDHVPREENPEASFLAELPAANAVPDGVIFLLGTQIVELPRLHPTIVQQTARPDRTIQIAPLTRSAVSAMANAASLPIFIDRDDLFGSCQGHPLTARYFVEALRRTSNAEEARSILSYANGLGQSLQEIYERVWIKLQTAASSKAALGILARAEGSLSPQQLSDASNDVAVEDIIKKASFLLAKSADDRIAIFHNSFRLFAAAETGKKFGSANPDLERGFQLRLAEIAQAAPPTDPQHWLELRYRSRAGDLNRVLTLATPTYFRTSLQALRPVEEIYRDLRLTYGAVGPTGDIALLVSKLLIAKELEYRLEAVSEIDFVQLPLNLGDDFLASKHALSGNAHKEGWLNLVDYYWRNNNYERAREVFDANEPFEILFASNGFDARQHLQLAAGWIQRAQRFRQIEKLVNLVGSLKVLPRPLSDEDDSTDLRKELIYNLALGALKDHRSPHVSSLPTSLELDDKAIARLTIDCAEIALADNNESDAIDRLNDAAELPAITMIHPSWRRAAALAATRLRETDLARRFADGLVMPRFDQSDRYSSDIGDVVHEIAELAYLAAINNIQLSEEQKSTRDTSPLLLATHTKLVELGQLQAQTSSSTSVSSAQALRSITIFFAQSMPDRNDFQAYKFYQALEAVATQLMAVATKLDDTNFSGFVTFVDNLIRENNNLSRSTAFCLQYSSIVFQMNGDSIAAERRISAAQSAARHDRTPHEAVASHAAFANALCEIGAYDGARATLVAMHSDTFGYWLRAKKEPQYTFWAWSFLNACDANPSRAANYALAFGQFILGMEETEGDETAMRLVADLLLGAAHDPSAAAGLTLRLLDSDLATWAKISDSALAAIAHHAPDLAGQALIAFSQLVAPFIDGGVGRALRTCITAMSSQERRVPTDLLVTSISTWVPPSERPELLKELIELAPEFANATTGIILEAELLANKLSNVGRGDAAESSTDRAVSTDIAASSLDELISYGDGKSDFGDGIDYSYARATEALVRTSSKTEIETFLRQRPHVERDSKVAVAISRRMLALGDRPAALQFFRKAEVASTSGHWSTFLGGQKLEVQRLRVELDGDRARFSGLEILVSELASGQTHGSSMFLNLEDILELVAADLPFEGIWTETEAHLKQYREFRLASPVTSCASINTHSDFLAMIVAQSFNFSCPELLQHARLAASSIARHSVDSIFIEKLFELLDVEPEGKREAAALMERLGDIAHLRETLSQRAIVYAENEDFVVANLAKRLLHRLGISIVPTPARSLPAFYKLATLSSPQADDFEPPPGVSSSQRPIWTEDPWTWTATLRLPLKLLSQACDIPMDQLRRRCAAFMTREGGRSAFGPEVEDAIPTRLRRMHLPFSYRRPLPMAALRAFGKLLQELDAAHAVDASLYPAIWLDIGAPSLSNWVLEIEPRPSWIATPAMPHRQYGGLDSDIWLEDAEADLASTYPPERFVLAEHTHFQVSAHRANAQSTKLFLPQPASPNRGMDALPRLMSLDRLSPMYRRDESQIVCQIASDLFGDLRHAAITICPYVAHSLGWNRSANSPLILTDSSGETVAQTVRWIDGTKPYSSYDPEIFGFGQTLFLSASGREQFQAQRDLPHISGCVEREFTDETRPARVRRVSATQ